MARTASQIQAERKAISDARKAIHEKQMADSGPVNAARTAAVLNAAGQKTEINPKTYEVTIINNTAPRPTAAKTEKQKQDLQYKREKQAETKAISQAASDRRSATKKAYDDYVKSDEYKQRVTANEQKARADAAAQLFLNPGQPMPQPQVIQDEKEQQLRAAMEQAEKEYNDAEDQKVIEQDLKAITGLSNEERQQLEQYAVNQIRDQNLPIEMIGVMPTARQEASDFIDKYGQKRADEMAETFMRQENEKLAQDVDAKSREFADKHGVIGSAATIPVAAVSGLIGSAGQLQGMARNTGRYKTLDPNATGTIGDTFTGAVRGQVGENIMEDLGGGFIGKAASLGYQGVMSAADSIARAYLGGGAFGGAALAATGSFSQTMAEASRNGATPAQAALLATTTAGIEALTEKIPLDNLIRTAKGQGAKTVIANALRQAGIEATTEEISLLGTVLAEAAILQEKSGYRRDVMTAIMNGMSPDDAVLQASQNIVDEAMNTALVSMISGGVSSLGGSYADARGLFAETQEQTNPELNRPKNVQQTTQEAIANNQARRERQAAEEATQQPQAAPVQQEAAQPDMQQEAPQQVQAVQQPQEAQQAQQQTPQPQTQQSLDEIFADMFTQLQDKPQDKGGMRDRSGYYDEFENWGVDPNREGVENPMADRKYSEVGKRDVKAYMYENPAVKPFYQEQAAWLLSELSDSTRGERTYNEQLHYDSGGEQGWSGTKRHTSDSIAELLDQDGMTYEQIEKGLNAIIHDNGQENNAISKRIEFVINDRLMNGYTDFYTGQKVPGNAEYLNLLRNQQSAPDVDTSEAAQMGASNVPQQSAEGVQGIKGTGAAEGNFSGKPAYNATLSEDNSQADRRDDVRPMELPQRDINGGNISAVTGNVYGASVTPDEFASLMEEPTARGDFSYVPISNNEATQQAMENITRYGWQDAYTQWSNAVHQGRAGAEMSARGALFLNHAAQAGDRQQWLNILSDFQRLGTNTAQGLQAFRILRNLAPSDRLYMMRRSVDQMVRDMHLNVPIEIDQQLADQYQNAQTNEEADAILDEIIDDVAAQIPSTAADRWTALRYVNMLGNMRTLARNISGNIGARFTYLAKDQIGAALEKVAHAFNPDFQRTKSSFVSNELKALGRVDFDEVRDIVLENGRFDDARRFDSTYFAREVNERRRIFRSGFMESYRRLTNWAMNNDHFGDAGFARSAYARAFGGYLKANGFTGDTLEGIDQNLLDDARLYAIQQAQESTFRDHNAVSDWVGRIGRRQDTPRAIRILSEGVMPFRSTPANVLVRAEEFSPLGIINTAVTAARAANPNSDITGTDVVESMAKTLTGTGLFIMGAYLGKMGMLAGGPDSDEEQAKFDKMNGYQNYALQLPDGKNITIDFLSPLAVPMFLGAELEKIIGDGGYDLADFEKVFTSLADPLIQMSMLQGINDTIDGIKYSENNLGQFFLNASMSYLTQGLTNTLMGQLERSSEENRMTTYVDKDSSVPQWMQQQLGKMSQKIPGWDYQQMDYVDAWGQKQKNEGGLLYNLLSPGYYSTKKSDAVTTELDRLREATGESVFPDAASKTITYTDKQGTVHKDYNLSAEQYQTYAQTQGQTARELWEDVVNTTDFDALTDAQKVKVSEDIKKYSREVGEIAAIGKDNHTGYSNGWMQDVEKGGAMEIIQRTIETGFSSAKENLSNAWKNGYDEAAFVQEMENVFRSFQNTSKNTQRQIYDQSSSSVKNYIDARENGLSNEQYLSVAKSLSGVGDTIIEKSRTIVRQPGLSESQKTLLVKQNVSDAQDENIDLLKALGYGITDYVDLYGDYKNYTSGKGKKNRTINKWMKDYGISYAAAKKLYEVFP